MPIEVMDLVKLAQEGKRQSNLQHQESSCLGSRLSQTGRQRRHALP